ncbi:MAG: hypothetical protein LLG04_10305, partial [Parachlamydia sp.]|nr:hypothetical protein [Parachlamydia sp.]
MASIEQVRALMRPTLTPQIEKLRNVPKSQKSTAFAQFFNSFNFPQVLQRRQELITIHASYKQLHKKIVDLNEKIKTLQLPMDLTKRESFQQIFHKEMTLGQQGILELETGIKLLAERSETANVKQLRAELDSLKNTVEEAKPKMEEHFVKLAKQQHIYKLATELRDMVQLFEKRSLPTELEGLSSEDKTTLAKAKDIAHTSQLAEVDFRALFSKVNAIVLNQSEAARELRYMAYNARRMDQPEDIINELLKANNSPKVKKEQVLNLIANELPVIVQKAFAHPSDGWYLISKPESLINQRLNAEELKMLKAMEAADFTKTAPETLITYTKKALQVIEKGFAAMPADVAAKRQLLNRGIEVYEQQFKEKRLDVDQRKNTTAQVAIDLVHAIDHAFACKTELGRAILHGKLLPPERDALTAVKAKLTSVKDDAAKLKPMAQKAIDLIEKAFNSQVPPFRATPIPADLKAELAE